MLTDTSANLQTKYFLLKCKTIFSYSNFYIDLRLDESGLEVL